MVQTWRFTDGERRTGVKATKPDPIVQNNVESDNNDVDISDSEATSSDIEDLEIPVYSNNNNNNTLDRLQIYHETRSLVGAWYKYEMVFSSLATQTEAITTLCKSLKEISLSTEEKKHFDKFPALLKLSIASHMTFVKYLEFDDAQWKNNRQSEQLDAAIEGISKTFKSMCHFALKTEILMDLKIKIGMLQQMIKEFIAGIVNLAIEMNDIEKVVIRKHLKTDIYAIGQFSYDIIEMSKNKNFESVTEKLRKYFVKMNRQAHLRITTNPIK